jgi:hypothetical protein
MARAVAKHLAAAPLEKKELLPQKRRNPVKEPNRPEKTYSKEIAVQHVSAVNVKKNG